MAIKTRFGIEVEIIGYLGEDTGYDSFDQEFTDEWVNVRYISDDPGREREMSLRELRADGGIDEIDEAIAPFKDSFFNEG